MKAKLGLGGYFSNPIDDPIKIIRHAYDNGIRFFDTAPSYGGGELWFGEALEGLPRGYHEISTKTKAITYHQLKDDLKNSLETLKSAYIDYYFGHDFIDSVESWHSHSQTLLALKFFKSRKLINKIGVSGNSTEAAVLAIDSGIVDCIMVPHSIMHRQFDNVISYAKMKKVQVITMKNFGSGILLGGNENRMDQKASVSLQNIMNFSIHNSSSDIIIPAVRSVNQLDELLHAYKYSFELSYEGTLQIEKRLTDFLGDDFCRFCNYCRPCDMHGWSMSQPGILKAYLYNDKFNIDMNETYQDYKLNATNCTNCDNLCSKRCPYGIDIKGRLEESHQYFTGGN
jgi:aryl-alcohol dehydrogenase-like predicted oxidoreductase